MAMTVTQVAKSVFGNYAVVIADCTFDNSYPTDGEALGATELALPAGTEVKFAMLDPAATATAQTPDGGVVLKYNYTSQKIQALWDDDPTGNADLIEVDNTTDLSAYSFRGLFLAH